MTKARAAILREQRLRKAAEKRAECAEVELLAERRGLARIELLTTRLFTSIGLQPLLNEVLAAALDLQQADFGTIQLYDASTCSLSIAVHPGFQQELFDHFRRCGDSIAVCRRALLERRRVFVEDVNEDPELAIHGGAAAGFRAVQATPLYTRCGAPLGVISTHFRKPHRPADSELRFTDLLARIAAELIERHRTEEALRVSEERFRRYFDLGLIGMAITSVQKCCIEVNDELCRILGYERAELLSKSWVEMTHPQDVAADVAQFNRVLAGEIDAYTLDKRWIRKDGSVIHSVMAVRCARRADRSVDYFVGLVLDTTGRQRAEAERAETERRFRTLIESIPHHVWSSSSEGSLGYWNRRLADYTGLAAESLAGAAWPALHPDDADRVRTAWRAAILRGTYELEHRMRGSDGRYRRFMCRAVRVNAEEGRPAEWFGTNTDVEDRYQAKEAVDALHRHLARAASATTLEEVAASIAHEIGQPLSAIIANALACRRWLDRETPNLAEATEAAARVVRDAQRASDIVARIRAFLRQEVLPVDLAPADINEVIAEVIAIVESELREHRVAFHMHTDAALPVVTADRIQLQQVVLNLVRNALDAMTTVTDRPRELHIGVQCHPGNALRVEVRDSGVGLAPHQRELAFTAFHTTKPNGMGMGLAISRSIVEAHGGRLWATPNDTYGETFHFTLQPAAAMPIELTGNAIPARAS